MCWGQPRSTSAGSFRGPGVAAGLKVLDDVRRTLGVPVLTDVHEDTPLAEVAAVVDVLQTPAFLCRQTNFIISAASCGKPVNIKKGQFLSPAEMQNVVTKARSTGNDAIMVCERGFTFGYNNLVSDMRSLSIMRATGCPVQCSPTHTTFRAGAGRRPGRRLRRAARIRAGAWRARPRSPAGIAGIIHGNTSGSGEGACPTARSAWPLARMESLLATLQELDRAVEDQNPFEESLL